MLSWAPPKTWGIGSETAWIWAVSGFDEQRHPDHDRAEIERPGRGGGDDRQGERGPVVGACEEDLAFDVQRRRAGAGGDRGAADQAVGRAARSGLLGRAGVGGGGRDRRLWAVGDAGELAGHPRRQGDVGAFQLLLAIAAGDVEREGLEGARLRPRRLRGKPGAKGRSASVFAQAPPPGALVRAKCWEGVAGGLPDQGVICALVVFGPQVGGLLRTARAPPSKLSVKELNGTCGVSAKVVVSWPVDRVGADVADQPHRDPVAGRLGVDEDPVLVARGRIAAELLPDVDVAGRGRLRAAAAI